VVGRQYNRRIGNIIRVRVSSRKRGEGFNCERGERGERGCERGEGYNSERGEG
jgi:hypothetical protein